MFFLRSYLLLCARSDAPDTSCFSVFLLILPLKLIRAARSVTIGAGVRRMRIKKMRLAASAVETVVGAVWLTKGSFKRDYCV